MGKYFLDSNIFLRVFVGDNLRMLKECLILFESIKKGKVCAVTSSVVLSEIVWTLGSFYKFPKTKVIEAIKSIMNIPRLEIVDDFTVLAALEIYQDNSVKFIDSLIASIYEIHSREWIVISYDKDFDKLGVIRKEPSQII